MGVFMRFRPPEVSAAVVRDVRDRFKGDLLVWSVAIPAIVSIGGGITEATKRYNGRGTDAAVQSIVNGFAEGWLRRLPHASKTLGLLSLCTPAFGAIVKWSGKTNASGAPILGGLLKVA